MRGMIEDILAIPFTLLGLLLIGVFIFYFYPYVLAFLVLFCIYKIVYWIKHSKVQKYQPNYQSGGYIPKGVAEDNSNEPLSFQTK